MGDCNNCINQHVLVELQQDKKRNSEQHKEFYEMLKQLEITNAITETNYSTILTTMAEIKKDIAELKGKPSKRWDTVITAIITGVVSVVVGFLVARG